VKTLPEGALGFEQIEYWRLEVVGFGRVDPLPQSLDSTLLNETFKRSRD
jgi:hypothetical protein